MKTIKYIALSFLMGSSGLAAFAQQTDVIKYSTPVKVEKNNGTAFLVTKKYFDGLERPVQSIDVGASAQNSRDVVSFVVYDNMGRGDAITYLPYVASSAANNGEKIANPLVQQQAFYQNLLPSTDPDRNYAYAQKQYDNSPLSLVQKEGGVGAGRNITAGNPTNHQYRQNAASEVKNFSVNSSGQLVYRGYHPAGALAVRRVYTSGTSIEDSDAYEYVNSLGQVVASEVRVSNADRRMTYYVYDDFGRKRYVIPPIQENLITTVGSSYNFDAIKKYCYYTEYDGRGNPIREWAPGGICTSNVFDLHGRLVLSQNPEMAKTNLWIFSKYDTQDRPVLSGTTTIAGTVETVASALQTYMAAAYSDRSYETRGTALHGYTNKCYPTGATQSQVLNVTYYDDYTWITNPTAYGFSAADAIAGTAKTANSVAGMTTGTKTKVLGAAGDQWLTSVTYYDNDYNPIQTISDLYPSGVEIVSNKHNFNGQVVQTKVKQVVDGVTYEYNKWLDYDAYGRLLKVRQKITGDPQNEVVLAEYAYDDLGRTVSKKIHGGKEETTYAYDIANRNTGTTSPSFSYRIGYDKSLISGVAGRRDGLISQITWSNTTTGEQKAYAYAYDKTKQYLSASFYEKSGATWTANAKYKETIGSYDTGGNIQSLQRSNGSGAALHNYTYTYGHPSNGYALTKISGSADFLYDANGNMTRDGATGVQIDYNILELPEKVYKGSDQITYIYAANGQKLAAQTGSSLTYYRSVMVYSKNGTAAQQLSYMIHPEGLAVREGSAWVYKYFKTDHLGNTRALLAVRNGSLVNEGQNTDYYPLGYAHSMVNLHLNKYLYSGKEYQDANVGGSALGLYDFGARFYNPSYGRWFNPDPANQFPNPYLYCANNPVNAIDPDGKMVLFINGMHLGSGGNPAYWGGFDNAVMSHLGDYNARYYDGSVSGGITLSRDIMGSMNENLGLTNPRFSDVMGAALVNGSLTSFRISVPDFPGNLSSQSRYYAGYYVGTKDAANILSQLSKGEMITIITHSMGAAFANGMIAGLIAAGVDPALFNYAAHFAPFQPGSQTADGRVRALQFSNYYDKIAFYNKMPGVVSMWLGAGGHSLEDFWEFITKLPSTRSNEDIMNDLKNLPNGKYELVDGYWKSVFK